VVESVGAPVGSVPSPPAASPQESSLVHMCEQKFNS
jgi:hypothetical protein